MREDLSYFIGREEPLFVKTTKDLQRCIALGKSGVVLNLLAGQVVESKKWAWLEGYITFCQEAAIIIEHNLAKLKAYVDTDEDVGAPTYEPEHGNYYVPQCKLTAESLLSNYISSLRVGEYPVFAEYLDAVVKQSRASTRQEGLEQEAHYINKCLDVKAKYPK